MRARAVWQKHPAASLFVAVFVVALAARLPFVLLWPAAIGDAEVYILVARNIVANGCISMSPVESAACLPHWGGNQPPGYPLFLAASFWLFGEDLQWARILQASVLSLCIAYCAYALARLSGRAPLALAVGLVIAMSAQTLAWPRHVFTESLALATTFLFFAEVALAIASRRVSAVRLALALAAAFMVRYDGMILASAFAALTIMLVPARRWLSMALISLVVFSIPVGVWIGRNVVVGLTPIAEMTLAANEGSMSGYLRWAKTWATSEYELPLWAFPAFSRNYSGIKVTARSFDSEAERERVARLFDDLSTYDGQPFPSAIDEKFELLADERRRAFPVRTFLMLPAKRAANIWLNPLTSVGWLTLSEVSASDLEEGLPRVAGEGGLGATLDFARRYPELILSKTLPTAHRYILLAATAAFLVLIAMRPGAFPSPLRSFFLLAVIYSLVRTGAFAFTINTSTRYIVEPAGVLEASVLALLVWRFLARSRSARSPPHGESS